MPFGFFAPSFETLQQSPIWLVHLLDMLLSWLIWFPLLPLVYVGLVLIAYNRLGNGLGMGDLFWHEKPLPQFLIGGFTAALVSQVLLVRYLLGPPMEHLLGETTNWTNILLKTPGTSENWPHGPLHDLLVYLWVLPIALLALIVPAFFWERLPGGSWRWLLPWRWPFIAGVAVSSSAIWYAFLWLARTDKLPAYVDLVPAVTPQGLAFSKDGPIVAWLVLALFLGVLAWKRKWSVLVWIGAITAVGLLLCAGLGGAGLLPRVVLDPASVPPPAPHPAELHTLAAIYVSTFFLAALFFFGLYRVNALTPMLSLLSSIAVLVGVYGFVAARAPGGQYLVIVLLIVWGLVANWHRHKIRLPTLEQEYEVSSRPAPPQAPPMAGTAEESFTIAGAAGLGAMAAQLPAVMMQPPGGTRHRLRIASRHLELIKGGDVLKRSVQNWKEAGRSGKPPLIVIAAAGGGIRAAVYTCAVLEQLEEQTRGDERFDGWFPEQVRLITGASGGLVGASYYVAHRALAQGNLPRLRRRPFTRAFRSADPPICPLAQAMALDSLSHTVATMLFHDLPLVWWPGWSAWDRGRALEQAWVENTTPEDGGPSPFACTIYDLLPHEAAARVPSLIFSPMLVEDARRLLISNLDLENILASGPRVAPGASPDPVYSLSAAEFFQEFPRVRREFPLRTAARMNASFPFLSPAVHLPMDPGRRVVDAGYYDNFGIDVACEWIRRHRTDISTQFGGLIVLQVRAFPCQFERHVMLPYPGGGPLRDVTSPLTAILNMRQRSPWYRNDQDLADLAELFAETNGVEFFQTAFVECESEAPLSWNMPTPKAEAVIREAASGVAELLRAIGG
jgi:hypothetical protein